MSYDKALRNVVILHQNLKGDLLCSLHKQLAIPIFRAELHIVNLHIQESLDKCTKKHETSTQTTTIMPAYWLYIALSILAWEFRGTVRHVTSKDRVSLRRLLRNSNGKRNALPDQLAKQSANICTFDFVEKLLCRIQKPI